jgi:hypothetical protein
MRINQKIAVPQTFQQRTINFNAAHFNSKNGLDVHSQRSISRTKKDFSGFPYIQKRAEFITLWEIFRET